MTAEPLARDSPSPAAAEPARTRSQDCAQMPLEAELFCRTRVLREHLTTES